MTAPSSRRGRPRRFGRFVPPMILLAAVLAGCNRTPAAATPTAGTLRIVSLSPAISRTLQDLGLADEIVGRSRFCDFLDEDVPVVGDLLQANYERLIELRPTRVLVQAPEEGIDPELIRLGERHGWTVHAWSGIDGIDDIERLVREIPAALYAAGTDERTRATARAAAIVVDIESALTPEAPPEAPPESPTDTGFWRGPTLLVWSLEPVRVFGRGTYLDEILVRLGGTSATDLEGYPELSLEDVTRLDPRGGRTDCRPPDRGRPDRSARRAVAPRRIPALHGRHRREQGDAGDTPRARRSASGHSRPRGHAMTGLSQRQIVGLLLLLALSTAAIILRLLVYRGLDDALTFSWPRGDIVRLRATAVVVATIVGAALAVSGLLLQALLRNPLASPFILGVSGGAALGVMIAMYLASVLSVTWLHSATHTGPALVGAVAALAVVYSLGQRRGWLDPVSLVLIGVVVSTICGALIMFLEHMVPNGLKADLISWMMGHISQSAPRGAMIVAGGLTLAGMAIAFAMGRAMDAATLGDDEARSVGLSMGGLRIALFLVAGALAAAAVSLAGPIGFVGLIAPHAARMILGPRHRVLLVGAVLAGITIIVIGDVASQIISVGGGRVPVGVFTALIGGPAFIWLLRTGRGAA